MGSRDVEGGGGRGVPRNRAPNNLKGEEEEVKHTHNNTCTQIHQHTPHTTTKHKGERRSENGSGATDVGETEGEGGKDEAEGRREATERVIG